MISDDYSVLDPDYIEPVNDYSDVEAITAERSSFDESVTTVVEEIPPEIDVAGPSRAARETRIHSKQQYSWTISAGETKEYEFLGDMEEEEKDSLKLHIEYFHDFISEQLLKTFVEQSNLYSTQKNPNKPLNIDISELEQWLGLCIYFSISKLPSARLHWSIHLGPLREFASSIMSRNRWEEIKANLHLVDNNTLPADSTNRDKLFKVRPMVDHLKTEFKKIPMNQHVCIDEQMVPFKGKHSMKQYIPNKPKKWGFKFLVLCDSSGVCHDFFPYTGKIDPVDNPEVPNLGASSNCVLRLAQTIPSGKNHLLYFDNWFTSLPLLQFLTTKQIYCCGTVRTPRLTGLKLAKDSDKQLMRKGRGYYEERTTHEDSSSPITYVRWYDNKIVNIVSTFAASQPVRLITRFDSKRKEHIDIQCPNIIQLYNKHMGGVDLADCLISLYRISIRSKKFYHRLIFHMLDMAIVNAWLIYRRQSQLHKIPEREVNALAMFKLRISFSLMKAGKTLDRPKRGRPSTSNEEPPAKKRRTVGPTQVAPEESIRFDQISHWPMMSKERKICKNANCSGKTNVQCHKCKVNLCFNQRNNCFFEFHNK